MGKLLKMEEAAQYLNVSQDCLRKWDRANKLKPLKTTGGHRRYSTDVLDEFLGVKEKPKKILRSFVPHMQELVPTSKNRKMIWIGNHKDYPNIVPRKGCLLHI